MRFYHSKTVGIISISIIFSFSNIIIIDVKTISLQLVIKWVNTMTVAIVAFF